MKRRKTGGKPRTHPPPSGDQIAVSEAANMELYWCDCGEQVQDDDRGHDAMMWEVGYLTDTDERWKLWYGGQVRRQDRRKREYPFEWLFIESNNPRSRKKTVNLDQIAPVQMNRQVPRWTAAELRLVSSLNKKGPRTTRQKRITHKMESWNLGIRTVERVSLPRFQIEPSETVDVKPRFMIDPASTSRVLLRIIERRMMHGPTRTIKDTELESLQQFLKILAALDADGFRESAELCLAPYVVACASMLPEPAGSEITDEFVGWIIKEAGPSWHAARCEPLMDAEKLDRWLGTQADDSLLSIDQCSELIAAYGIKARGSKSPRRLADRFRKLGIGILTDPELGPCITVGDYRRHAKRLLRHGNEKAQT